MTFEDAVNCSEQHPGTEVYDTVAIANAKAAFSEDRRHWAPDADAGDYVPQPAKSDGHTKAELNDAVRWEPRRPSDVYNEIARTPVF